jgi:hypothetical protein
MPGTPLLVAPGAVKLVGITKDEQIVYLATAGTALPALQTIPMAGGTPTVLLQSFDVNRDVVVVSGGAVGFWTDVNNNRGTFNLWTRVGGLKTNLTEPTDSAPRLFAASDDGTRVAFGVGSTPSASDLAIADATSVALTTTGIFGTTLVNTAAARGTSPSCTPDLKFLKRTFVGSFCTGTSSVATAARLYYVPDGSNVDVRLDNIGAEVGNIKPAWSSDPNGSKIFVTSSDGFSTGRIITPPINGAAPTSVALEDESFAGFVTNDAATVIYRTTSRGLRRASTGPNPAPQTLVSGVRTIIDISQDFTRVLVRTLSAASGNLLDIRSADVTTMNQTPKDIVPTASARPLGFTGDGTEVLYLTDVSGSSNHLRAQSAMGGPASDLGQNVVDVAIPEAGAGAIVFNTAVNSTSTTTPNNGSAASVLYTIKFVNAATGRSSDALANDVPSVAQGGVMFLGRKLVYASQSQQGSGIYVAALP